MKYYFLVTYLPEIQRDDKKIKLRLADLLEERPHIEPGDWRQVELVLLARDILLLEKLLSGKDAAVEPTLYEKDFWKEQMKAPREVPAFLEEVLLDYAGDRRFGPEQVDRLYGSYYDYVIETTASDFLRGYFLFEKQLRNILAAIRARRKGLAPADHVVGKEGWVEELLCRSSAEDFGLGRDLPWIERLLEAQDPVALDDAVEQILWEYVDEQTERLYFDFDAVLAYMMKLQLLERRLALSEERGMETVRELEGP